VRLLPYYVSAAAILFLCAGPAAAAETSRDWESTVAAAEKEGQVAVYMGGEVSQMRIEEAFQSAYPKIKVTALTGRGSQLGPRIIAERRAGKYLVDLFIGGKGTAYSVLYPAKVLAPISPLLSCAALASKPRNVMVYGPISRLLPIVSCAMLGSNGGLYSCGETYRSW